MRLVKANCKTFKLLIICCLLLLGYLYCPASASQNEDYDTKDFFDMPLEKLMDMEILSSATLTDTNPRLIPAAVTTLTSEQIRASGARSLFELLDIYVPNLQWKRNLWEADNIGLRGIINDRDDKYLLLVNGRIMNERTHYGAMSERDLVLLGEIHHIDIVRGPGSALYGPGAVSMVINIITYNYETFQGTEITTRTGAIEEFYSAELKHGRKFKDGDGGIFLYAGIGHYLGADKYDAPQIFGFDFPAGAQMGWDTHPTPADGTQAGHPLLNPSINNDGETYNNLPPLKLHAEINRGNWDIWARYTRGGKQYGWDPGMIARAPYGWYNWSFLNWSTWPPGYNPILNNEYGYQQFTGYIGYRQPLTERIDVDYAFSYQMLDYLRTTGGQGYINESYREDNYFGKVMLKWKINRKHRIALGTEISHSELGLQSSSLNRGNPYTDILGSMPQWSTDMYSIVGEHQWNINDKLTTFLGARLDDHSYTSWMFSPRAAVIYTPTKRDTFKFLWSRSVRASYEEEMKAQDMDPTTSSNSKPEILDSAEIRYERQCTRNLDIAASLFVHYNLEVISYSAGSSSVLGRQKEWGAEFELSYHTDKTGLTLSHGYTKLMSFDLQPGKSTFISAEPYGYGDDLAQWSNHITKVTAWHKFTDKFSVNGSMRIYWGFPGMRDYDEYARDTAIAAGSGLAQLYRTGWNDAYRGNYYLDLGMQYKHSDNLTVGVFGYYLLGIFDKDLNKRNTGYTGFRSHAPAVSVAVTYRF